MFVVQANVPPQFKLFELIGNDYYLNFLDGMTGRVALATGITDLVALKGQAKRVGPAYQVRLTEEARGKVVIGETTFLFQFVAPPPVQPRPQLPLSVKGGLASQIDWNLTIIAAFSFLLHFGLIGAMYSDWMDPVVNDDLTAGPARHGAEDRAAARRDGRGALGAAATDTAPLRHGAPEGAAPAEGPSRPAGARARRSSPACSTRPTRPASRSSPRSTAAPNTRGAMKDDNGAPVDLNSLANRQGGISNTTGGLNLPGGAGGPIKPGQGPGVCSTSTAATRDRPRRRRRNGRPRSSRSATCQYGGASMSVPVSERRGRSSAARSHPGAKRCYQKGLESDPTQSGRLVISRSRSAPSGEVDSASVASNSGLSARRRGLHLGGGPPREVRRAGREAARRSACRSTS